MLVGTNMERNVLNICLRTSYLMKNNFGGTLADISIDAETPRSPPGISISAIRSGKQMMHHHQQRTQNLLNLCRDLKRDSKRSLFLCWNLIFPCFVACILNAGLLLPLRSKVMK